MFNDEGDMSDYEERKIPEEGDIAAPPIAAPPPPPSSGSYAQPPPPPSYGYISPDPVLDRGFESPGPSVRYKNVGGVAVPTEYISVNPRNFWSFYDSELKRYRRQGRDNIFGDIDILGYASRDDTQEDLEERQAEADTGETVYIRKPHFIKEPENNRKFIYDILEKIPNYQRREMQLRNGKDILVECFPLLRHFNIDLDNPNAKDIFDIVIGFVNREELNLGYADPEYDYSTFLIKICKYFNEFMKPPPRLRSKPNLLNRTLRQKRKRLIDVITAVIATGRSQPGARDMEGKTALDYARENNIAEIIPLLSPDTEQRMLGKRGRGDAEDVTAVTERLADVSLDDRGEKRKRRTVGGRRTKRFVKKGRKTRNLRKSRRPRR